MRSEPTNELQLDRPSLTMKGSAPKFSKRTILTGPGSFLSRFSFFSTLSQLRSGVIGHLLGPRYLWPQLRHYEITPASLISPYSTSCIFSHSHMDMDRCVRPLELAVRLQPELTAFVAQGTADAVRQITA